MKTKLFLVGGFLGAGKTTLLRESARRLIRQGHLVGLITNDQTTDLVDTAFLTRSGADVREVSGSCFCCNFDGFMDAVQSLIERGTDIIIAEPVGSCTDLSATILQPIKDKYPAIDLAPFTVLVDPERVREVLRKKNPLMHENALYILRLQMLEADRILLNKVDTLSTNEQATMLDLLRDAFPEVSVDPISAKTGEGLETWLTTTLEDKEAGVRIVDVDYDRYAEGEAVLGWLNAVINLESTGSNVEWAKYGLNLMSQLHKAFQKNNAEIGHVKLQIESGDKECTVNLTHLGRNIALQEDDDLSGMQACCILNARVQISAPELEKIVREAIGVSNSNEISTTILSLKCLMPGRPNPTYRYSSVSHSNPSRPL
jgi:G3E family GTPase